MYSKDINQIIKIIKRHNKKIVQKETQETLDCSCRVKTDRPLNGDCRKESVIYECTATTCDSKKVYLGLTEGDFKKQRYHGMSNLLKTNFMVTVLPCQVIHGK